MGGQCGRQRQGVEEPTSRPPSHSGHRNRRSWISAWPSRVEQGTACTAFPLIEFVCTALILTLRILFSAPGRWQALRGRRAADGKKPGASGRVADHRQRESGGERLAETGALLQQEKKEVRYD